MSLSIGEENFGEWLTIRQIRQFFPLPKFSMYDMCHVALIYLSYGLMQTNFYSKSGHIHGSVHSNANLSASTYKFSTITSSTVLVGSSPDDKITLLFSDHIMSIVYKTPVTLQ